MQEEQVSVEGVTYKLPTPFLVIGSQLPYGYEGIFPLTELQADRFMFRAWSDYPSESEEKEIVGRIDEIEEVEVSCVASPEEVLAAREEVKSVFVSDNVKHYIVSLVNHLRRCPDVAVAPSVRGSVALLKGSRALAALKGRDYVIPDDVKELAHVALDHRVRVKAEAEMEGVRPSDIVDRALREVEVPK